MSTESLKDAAEAARDMVLRGAEVARDHASQLSPREKEDGSGVVTEADMAIDELLVRTLRERFPDDEILSEESARGINAGARRIWCVDPLDGTREYVKGLPEYAVMAGLLLEGRPAAGAFALPATKEVFWGWEGGGAFVRDTSGTRALRLAPLEDLARATFIHSRNNRRTAVQALAQRLGVAGEIAAGGAGYKVAQILLGHAHLYVHLGGGTHWWDSAAPAAVLLAAGGTFATATAAPLEYADPTRHPDGLLFAVPALPLDRLGPDGRG